MDNEYARRGGEILGRLPLYYFGEDHRIIALGPLHVWAFPTTQPELEDAGDACVQLRELFLDGGVAPLCFILTNPYPIDSGMS